MGFHVSVSRTRIIADDPARVGAFVEAQGGGIYRDGMTAVGWERDGQITAGVTYDNFTGVSMVCAIAITAPVTRHWLWYIGYYPFVQAGCRSLLAFVAHDNIRSHRFVQKFGFRRVVDLSDVDPAGLCTLYQLRREDCRFLALRRSHG